jgi:hypothetical protein
MYGTRLHNTQQGDGGDFHGNVDHGGLLPSRTLERQPNAGTVVGPNFSNTNTHQKTEIYKDRENRSGEGDPYPPIHPRRKVAPEAPQGALRACLSLSPNGLF